MFAIRAVLFIVFITTWYSYAKADTRDLQTCETHLNKYRRFLLQAILNFEDVCDAYNAKPVVTSDNSLPPQIAFFGHYQPSEQKAEIWTFFKLLMAQFSDVDFANTVRDAVIDRCHLKFQQQLRQQKQQLRDEKRNTVVLGKKPRFHSWGGKRSGGDPMMVLPNEVDIEQENNDAITLPY